MHIISDLVLDIEGDLGQVPEDITSASEEIKDDNTENAVLFGELHVLDSIVGRRDISTDQDLIEQADKEKFKHHLPASVGRNDGRPPVHGKSFRGAERRNASPSSPMQTDMRSSNSLPEVQTPR